MSKYIPDVSTRHWIIIASSRSDRGEDTIIRKSNDCIFCEGNEHLSPDEVYRLGPGHPNESGWKVRVLHNKFPITDIHEVVIHSTEHEKDFEQLHHVQAENILTVFKERFNEHKNKGQVVIFNNHGTHAGASQTHPHSQIVVIPHQINLNMLERQPIQKTIIETKHFSVYCPDFSQWSYEVWIAPHKENTDFGDIDTFEIADLSLLLKRIIRALSRIYDTVDIFAKINRSIHPFGYNLYIYPKRNWYLRIVPRFVHLGGFEIATGLSVNMVDPSDAAVDLIKFLL